MIEMPNPAALHHLVGKTVRVFKGGYESKQGILLAAYGDLLVLLTERSRVIYYQLTQVSSVEQDFSASPFKIISGIPEEVVSATTFQQLLISMVNRLVQVEQGGSEANWGVLRYVSSDYFVIETIEKEFIYYYTPLVKSIGRLGFFDENEELQERQELFGHISPLDQYIEASSFYELILFLKNTYVRINQRGPRSIDGTLTELFFNYLNLVHEKSVYHLPIAHIHSIVNLEKDIFPYVNPSTIENYTEKTAHSHHHKSKVRVRKHKHKHHHVSQPSYSFQYSTSQPISNSSSALDTSPQQYSENDIKYVMVHRNAKTVTLGK
ncbi:hypothetical protein [Brevibacillus daliensis]|uniref:hypothetical protein n=1 Tax=Brevibacillus daliensis TaxID=2892995 RepID=UPI001E342F05|nr:hypothetical protein [Brevibacillus daliensis]